MNLFATNCLMAVGWGALMGSLSLFNLVSGYVIGYAILWQLVPLVGGSDRYFKRVFYWIRLIVMFHYELVVSSVQVVWDVLTPQHLARPGIIE
ncbi:MAG: Na+/H+ antiporter subunit E, partial [Pseudomonadota bacterium]